MDCSITSKEKIVNGSSSDDGEERHEKNEEMVIDCTEVTKNNENKNEENEEQLCLKRSILNHISTNDKVCFTNPNGAEEELSVEQKFQIVQDLLERDYGVFLVRFGRHLQKRHLSYFENRNEDDALIVDIHLKQLRRLFEEVEKTHQPESSQAELEQMEVSGPTELCSAEQTRLNLRTSLLNHLCLSSDAHFRSQQVGEPDLKPGEKREIAEQLLDRSFSLFLAKFGTHLLEEHLEFFNQASSNDYEVEYHLKRLRKTHCKSVSKVGIKNRRFEALKKLCEEGSYFSESEMRSRNPLLYEELVGKFLTAEERKERIDNIDTTNITLVNLLLEKMDREAIKDLRKKQKDAEDDVMEEEEEDTSDEEMDREVDSEEDNDLDKSMWGESYTDSGPTVSKKPVENISSAKKQNKSNINIEQDEEDVPELEESEKYLLLQEFRSNMFSNFLQGKDADFDYSKVDYNSDYDDLEAQGHDEEERYFDDESSQDASSHKMSDDEDPLEQYMKRLGPEPTPQQLADRLNDLTHEDT